MLIVAVKLLHIHVTKYIPTSLIIPSIFDKVEQSSIFDVKWSYSGLTKQPFKALSKCCYLLLSQLYSDSMGMI